MINVTDNDASNDKSHFTLLPVPFYSYQQWKVASLRLAEIFTNIVTIEILYCISCIKAYVLEALSYCLD